MNRPGGDSAHDADMALWHEVARTVTPLRGRPRPAPRASDAGEPAPMPKPAAAAPARPVNPERGVQGAAAGIDRRQAARLRRGQLTIEGRCDLHGP